MRFLGLTVFMALALPVAAQEPASIGVTRDGITSFLVEEGFDSPYFVEDYPPFDGETYTSAHVPPGIDIDMYGPDEGLTYIEARFRATDDSNEQYWQGLLAVKIPESPWPHCTRLPPRSGRRPSELGMANNQLLERHIKLIAITQYPELFLQVGAAHQSGKRGYWDCAVRSSAACATLRLQQDVGILVDQSPMATFTSNSW